MPVAPNERKQRKAAANEAIPLTDENGSGISGALLDGTAVEILGWVPDGTKTLYRVRLKEDGELAWVASKDLRAGMSSVKRPGSRKRAAARKAVRARAKRPAKS